MTNRRQKCLDRYKSIHGPEVIIPIGDSIRATEQGKIPLSPLISTNVKEATILPRLKSSSLISLGQLADDGCTMVLDSQDLTAIKIQKNVLQGKRNFRAGLWDIPIQKTSFTKNIFSMPKIHPSMYSTRINQDQEKCAIIIRHSSTKLPIKKVQFESLVNLISSQLRLDRLYSPITSHLQNLDSLHTIT